MIAREVDVIYNEDCISGLSKIPDGSVDLVIMDPPYEISTYGMGAFGSKNCTHFNEIDFISNGISNDTLDIIISKLKKINIYIWCNKNQIRQYINYFDALKCTMDLLTWHKTNPVPTCSNKYLSDTEYCLFFREHGVPIRGTYETKKKWYATPLNVEDKEKYNHPTIKPLQIIQNLILNSMPQGGGIVLDPFLGSGTTAVAAVQTGNHYVGFEINSEHYQTALKRLERAKSTAGRSLYDYDFSMVKETA